MCTALTFTRTRASSYTNAVRVWSSCSNAERKESEKKKHIPRGSLADKNLIVVRTTGAEEPLRLKKGEGGGREKSGRANRIEQIATLSKLSGRADRPEKNARHDC